MDFYEVVDDVLELLRQRGRVTYRALKRQFNVDDEFLEDLKEEIIYGQRLAVDEDDRVLVWVGDTDAASTPSPARSVPEPTTSQTSEPEYTPASYTPAYLAEKILTGKTSLEGERKVVTVLFADIKDSTELIRDLDPEDAQKLLDPAIHIMMDAVHRFEGTVNQTMGDGVMSLFGAPIAHEDHASRACYSALAMQSAMRDYTEEVRRKQGLELRIRVGLNSGEVVVRAIGNDLHMDYSAVGQTTHLAARMEQLASPGSIRLSSSTLRLVEGLVQVNDLGPIPVKGMTEPVEVYELTGASSVRRRLQAAVARGLTRFVGRDLEIDALNQALEQAGAGHGQIVAAVGEAGVGKSRLMYEFIHSHRTQGWLVLESASVSYGKATPYFPVIDLLKRYTHVEDGDDARTIRAKVTGQILTLDESLQDTIPALLSLLDALPEDSPFLKIDPPQRRQRTLDGLKRILLRESQVQPLVLVCEDLHWHDSESQALLDSLVESLPTAQLLILVNYRPEYTHKWGSKTCYTQLRLDPLGPESADALLDALLGDDASLESLKRLLIERTQGVPFFLEESVRTLVETQVLAGEPGAYCLAQDIPSIQVPPTVQAVLAARIDRLPQDEKSLLQTASVIGTEVPFKLLQAIAEIPEDTLYRGLAHLQTTEFLYETSLFPERVFTFKHALTHEVAYNSLLQEQRRTLHVRIVEVLEERASGQLSEQVERLAHHAFRGERWHQALRYLQESGAKAMASSANQEAAVYFEQALETLKHIPEDREASEQAIDLRFSLRTALLPLGNFERVLEYLNEAQALSENLADLGRQGRASLYMMIYFWNLGEHDQAVMSGQRAVALAKAREDAGLEAVTNAYLGIVYQTRGEYPQAKVVFRRAIEILKGALLYERLGMITLPSLTAHFRLARCLAELGEFPESISMATEGARIAEAVDLPTHHMFAGWGFGLPYLWQGNLNRAIPALERAMDMCRESNFLVYTPFTASTLGAAYMLSGRVDDALPLIEQAMQQADSIRFLPDYVLTLATLGEACLLIDCIEDANNYVLRALDHARDNKEPGNTALVLRLLGDIDMHHNSLEIDQAKIHYQQSLTLANELGMKPLQAHCHRGLGKLYCQTGQLEQARTELSTAIDMYRDMEMTFWIPETETALAAVEAR